MQKYLYRFYDKYIQDNKCQILTEVRAVISLEDTEGHQHLAGWHGGGCKQNTNLSHCAAGFRGSRPPDFFLYIFNTKSCILMHSLTPKMDTISVFIKTLCIGGKEDCRLPNEAQRAARAKIEAEGLDCCPLPKVLREGAASPTS